MTTKGNLKHNSSAGGASLSKTPTRSSSRPRSKAATLKMNSDPNEMKLEDVDDESKPLTEKVENMDSRVSSLKKDTSDSTREQTVSHISNVVQSDAKQEKGELNQSSDPQKISNQTDKTANGTTHEKRFMDDSSVNKTLNKETVTAKNEKAACNGNAVKSDGVKHIPNPLDLNNLTRKESLTVPGTLSTTDGKTDGRSRSESVWSFGRESSKLSAGSPRSPDMKVQYTTVQMPVEDKTKSMFTPDDSWIRTAIPYLPLGVAILCLLMNIIVPGSGTVVSGLSIFCCAKSRVPAKYDQDTLLLLCVNTWVGVAQLFTVSFMFVGWFWSLAWGIKMVALSMDKRREKKMQRAKELQTLALSAFGSTLPGRVSVPS